MNSISFTYRILAFTMALLMFVTSVGFTVDMHFCKDQLKTFNFLGKAKSCHDLGAEVKSCPHHNNMVKEVIANNESEHHKGCCSNKTFYFQSDQDHFNQLDALVEYSPTLQSFYFNFVESFLNEQFVETKSNITGLYKHPLISRDIYVLLESFLL